MVTFEQHVFNDEAYTLTNKNMLISICRFCFNEIAYSCLL